MDPRRPFPRALSLVLPCLLAGCGNQASILFVSRPPGSAAIRAPLSYQAAVRFENGPATFALVSGPAGATVTNTGLLQWTPVYADLGVHTFALQATDSSKSVTQNFQVRVHQGIDMGVALSPRGHTQTSTSLDFAEHLQPDSPHGRLRGFHGNWRNSVLTAGVVPQLFQSAGVFVNTFGTTPAFVVGWADGTGTPDLTSESEPGNNSWSNVETRNEFLAMVTALAQQQQPPTLLLGNEVNMYLVTHSPTEWADWLSQYQACYTAIKAVSPNTQVGMVWQLELLKGLGANVGWTFPAQWTDFDAVVAAGSLDVMGFTSYPYLHYDLVTDLLADHYEEIALHWTGRIAFTEIAWPAAAHPPFPGSESQQADFVTSFFALSDDLEMLYVAWLFLHDFDGQALHPGFEDIGLRNNQGTVIRLADALWQSAVALRQQ
jgi:hypothetical protein